jgi:LmbE family N-acetylglucosaminyl deacetylase
MISEKPKLCALAAGAHPDDIEFMMAGTLLLLKEAGVEIHMWNLANGGLGSVHHGRTELIELRWQEAQDAAHVAGATAHPPLFDDLAVFYNESSLRRVASVVRAIQPDIILTHSPEDYMEDHQNTRRLIVSAAFARGMSNFVTDPPHPPYDHPVAVYHALPHGLQDGLRNAVQPDSCVNIASVLAKKREMLANHRSQKEWLEASQGMDAYLNDMENMSREVGRLSGRFQFAEGWRQHSHLGFCPPTHDPLAELLKGNHVPSHQ